MPTYSYACTECDNKFDVVQAFTDDSLTECPQCNGRLRKVFGKVGVVFKGSGFYRTDSRESGKTPAASSSGDGSGSSSESSTSSSSSEKSSSSDKSSSADKSASSSSSSSTSSSAPAAAASS